MEFVASRDRQRPSTKEEPPRPRTRKIPPGKPFPVEALGNVLGPAASAIHDRIQAPFAIGAQSVLGAATLAAQSHADVVLPIGPDGEKRPLSNFFEQSRPQASAKVHVIMRRHGLFENMQQGYARKMTRPSQQTATITRHGNRRATQRRKTKKPKTR